MIFDVSVAELVIVKMYFLLGHWLGN